MSALTQVGQNIDEVYELDPVVLGKGASGKVVIGLHRQSGQKHAIKQVPKYRYNQEILKTEIEILSRLSHPSIVKFFGAYESPRIFYLALELCRGGELFDRIVARQHYSEKDASILVRQMLTMIQYCHQNNIVHRDLKPDNFLFETPDEDSPLKLIDFGLAKHCLASTYMNEIRGTPYYIAPEVLNQHYDSKCDLWSIGVITYVLLVGYPPFYAESDPGIYAKIRRGRYSFPSNIQISDSAKDLISQLLQMDPAQRLTASQALQHPWVLGDSASSAHLRTALDSLKSFNDSCRLRHQILTVLSSNLSQSDLEQMRKQFVSMDLDQNGVISLNELKIAMSSQDPDGQAEIERMLRSVDVDQSGSIDYQEFINAATQRKLFQQEESLWQSFQRFDTNGDGFISRDELQRALNYENPEQVALLEEMIKEVDVNNDGKVNYEEFLDMMRGKRINAQQ